MILAKKNMSEEDIKLQYITPAITANWNRSKITMETKITNGKINLKGNFVFREKPKSDGYILYLFSPLLSKKSIIAKPEERLPLCERLK